MITYQAPNPTVIPAKAGNQNQPTSLEPTERKVELTDNALVVLEKRYLRKDADGNIVETPEQMLRRVAHAIAQPEATYGARSDAAHWEDEFFEIMASLDFRAQLPYPDERRHRPA